ncbi:family 6 glucosyltransferase [Aeromonas veronii]
MKVNVFYICTNKYSCFFEDFFESSEKFFLPKAEKKYFVFTDAYSFEHTLKKYTENRSIRFFIIDSLCWPLNTLMRFEYFRRSFDELDNDSYTFFFNANALFLKEIDEYVLPQKEHGFLVGVQHPGYTKRLPIFSPFERRGRLSCFVPFSYGGIYYQGCLNGGRTKEFSKLIQDCFAATTNDLKNNEIAKVHDESYLNWFFYKEKIRPLTLRSDYAWPEEYPENINAKILMRNKKLFSWYQETKE